MWELFFYLRTRCSYWKWPFQHHSDEQRLWTRTDNIQCSSCYFSDSFNSLLVALFTCLKKLWHLYFETNSNNNRWYQIKWIMILNRYLSWTDHRLNNAFQLYTNHEALTRHLCHFTSFSSHCKRVCVSLTVLPAVPLIGCLRWMLCTNSIRHCTKRSTPSPCSFSTKTTMLRLRGEEVNDVHSKNKDIF